ncbi:glycosyltransferase [Kocuria arenosa]|uniref:glycosyltransferase n=1 Tax=Kocuria arenosa TaxID=3071446 RepID=UPI0034D3FC3C
MSAKSKVVIVQPYVPAYRLSFFEALRERLLLEGVECHVASTAPNGSVAARGDAVTEDWFIPLKEKTVRPFGKRLKLDLHPQPWDGADAVIMGLEGISLPVHRAIHAKRRTTLRVGLWGHIKPYVTDGNVVDLYLERRLMKAANRVFAYTPGGAEYAVRSGISPDKVTTVMNTVDTSKLLADLASVTDSDIKRLINQYALQPDKTVCFVGAIDAQKRIDFLAEALDHLWNLDPSIKIVVGGRGADEHLLAPAVARGQAATLGYLKGKDKATVLRLSRAICVPGRVGLVAVDALAASLPVMTTDWPFHAPETEYLVEGQSRYTSANDPVDFARTVKNFLDGPISPESFDFPTMPQMVDNFASGVVALLRS